MYFAPKPWNLATRLGEERRRPPNIEPFNKHCHGRVKPIYSFHQAVDSSDFAEVSVLELTAAIPWLVVVRRSTT